VTTPARKALQGRLKVATLDPYRLTSKQSISHFLPRRVQNAGKGSPRDIHPLSAILLLKLLYVLQADCFRLLDRKLYLL